MVNAATKKEAARTSSNSSSSSSAVTAAAAATSVVDEGEMNSLLSQYLPGLANNTATQPTGSCHHSSPSLVLVRVRTILALWYWVLPAIC